MERYQRMFLLILSLVVSLGGATLALADGKADRIDLSYPGLTLSGVFEQGGFAFGAASPGDAVFLGDQKVRVATDGRFFIGFHRDSPSSLILTYEKQGRPVSITLNIAKRHYDIQRIDGLPSNKVTPDPARLARIRTEAEAVWLAREIDTPLTNFVETFAWPLKGDPGTITGVFGSQRVLNGQPRQPHYGVDIAAPTGTPVYAPAGGAISFVHDDMFFSGGTFMIDHGHGLASTFLHMDTIDVSKGDTVVRGQRIGTVGETGRATGPHLDWRVNWFQNRLDPMHFVQAPAQ